MKSVALILLILCNAGETIGYKCSRDSFRQSAYGASLWAIIFSLPVCLALSCFSKSEVDINTYEIVLLIVIGVIGVGSSLCWAKQSKMLPMSIAEGVSEIYIAILAIVCWLFFDMALSILQICLIAIVIGLCLLLAVCQSNHGKSKKQGFLFLGIWVILAVIKGALPSAVSDVSASLYLILPALVMFVLSAMLVKNFWSSTKLAFTNLWLMLIGLCRVVSNLAIFYLSSRVNLGLADAVSVCGLVIIILFEWLVTKVKLRKICYPILALLAIATILLCLV